MPLELDDLERRTRAFAEAIRNHALAHQIRGTQPGDGALDVIARAVDPATVTFLDWQPAATGNEHTHRSGRLLLITRDRLMWQIGYAGTIGDLQWNPGLGGGTASIEVQRVDEVSGITWALTNPDLDTAETGEITLRIKGGIDISLPLGRRNRAADYFNALKASLWTTAA